MKLSRRCFLSFSIGGAVGTALTPLPWKLTDDMSIWSQNWPWTPVPADGEVTYVDSTCTLCPGHCGIRVRKVDDRAVKIEGQEGTPLDAGGGVCLLGVSGLQLLYGPTRVKGPLRKVVGQDGQSGFESISWQTAIDELAKRMAELRAQGKPHTVACLVDQENGTIPLLFKRFMKSYGSPNYYHMPSIVDSNSVVLKLTQGAEGFAGLDVEHTDYLLSFGSALLDGYGSPLRMIQAIGRLKDQHGTFVQVEPRLSNTAAKADVWLAPKPGTEADLALAMAYVIIDQRRFNEDFVYNYTEDFGRFAIMVRNNFAPETVAATTGIDAGTIASTALAFAGAERPLALSGRGKGDTPGSLKEALAVNALNILVGNINQPGGFHAMPAYNYIDWPIANMDGIAYAGFNSKRLDAPGTPSVYRMIDAVDAAPENLQLLMVAEANPCHSLKDSGKIKQVFDKIPYVVSFSSFMDETAMQADLILPNHFYLERMEDVPVLAGATRPIVGLCRPVVAPLYDTQHIGDTIIQLAKAIKGPVAASFRWHSYDSCLKEALGDKWTDMNTKGYWAGDTAAAPIESGFNTPSGKMTMMSDEAQKAFSAPLPAPAGDKGRYPLLLVSYDSIRLSSRYIGDPPFMLKVLPDTVLKGKDGFVALNPETAGRLGLNEGHKARLSTPLGEATVRIHLDHGIMPDLLAMPTGLGHTAYDAFLSGKGVNINQLIGPVEDPATGLDAAWGIQANLAKA